MAGSAARLGVAAAPPKLSGHRAGCAWMGDHKGRRRGAACWAVRARHSRSLGGCLLLRAVKHHLCLARDLKCLP